MIECCDTIVGGEIYITANISNANPTTPSQAGTAQPFFEALGDVRIQPASIGRAAGVTSAGTLWVTEAARPVRALMTFINRCNPNPMALFCSRCNLLITVVEKTRGITHLFTDAVIVGDPEINLSSGEVSGIEIACSGRNYTIHADRQIELEQTCIKPIYTQGARAAQQAAA